MSTENERPQSAEQNNFSDYAVHFLSEIGWKGFKIEDIQDFTGRALVARSRISKLEAINEKLERRIETLDHHKGTDRRIREAFKSKVDELEAKCKRQEEALRQLESDNTALKNNNRCLKKVLSKFDTEVTSLDSMTNLVCVRCGRVALDGKKEGNHCGQINSSTTFCSGEIKALKP